MKLSVKFLILLISLTLCNFISASEAEDVEIEIDDDEAEIFEDIIDDDMDNSDADDDNSEFVGNEVPEEEQPMLSPVPMEGVRSFVFFPDGPASITGGIKSEIVVGIQNNGVKDIEMVNCNGKMMMPNTNEVVQNFTNVGYENHEILAKSEASFSYIFLPHLQTGGREFQVELEVYYKEKNTNTFYKAMPFNEIIQVLESTEGVMAEIVQLWMTVIALLVGGSWFFYNKHMIKKNIKEATATGKKVERGTVNEDIDMGWIPTGHKSKSK